MLIFAIASNAASAVAELRHTGEIIVIDYEILLILIAAAVKLCATEQLRLFRAGLSLDT